MEWDVEVGTNKFKYNTTHYFGRQRLMKLEDLGVLIESILITETKGIGNTRYDHRP